MDYAEFTELLLEYLWRKDDAVVIEHIDDLIRLADKQLDRELRVEDRHNIAAIEVDQLDLPLPSDYKSIRSVTIAGEHLPPLTYIGPAQLLAMREQAPNTWRPFYSLIDKTLLLSGYLNPDKPETNPTAYVDYLRAIPDFKATDSSWVADMFTDVYLFCVLSHATTFVREDERTQMWQSYYVSSLASALEESEFYRKRGVSASKPLPRQAGINRRKRR